MDADWALGELRTFVDLTRLGPQPSMAGVAYFGDARSVTGAVDTIIASAQVVEQIVDRALPGWRSNVPEDESGRWQRERQAAQRAIVQLEREAEVQEKLGDNAPKLDAARMHPWVWEGAHGRCGRAATTAKP